MAIARELGEAVQCELEGELKPPLGVQPLHHRKEAAGEVVVRGEGGETVHHHTCSMEGLLYHRKQHPLSIGEHGVEGVVVVFQSLSQVVHRRLEHDGLENVRGCACEKGVALEGHGGVVVVVELALVVIVVAAVIVVVVVGCCCGGFGVGIEGVEIRCDLYSAELCQRRNHP